MTSRERVRAALNHQMTDKLPVDFGTTNVSTIHLEAYKKLVSILSIKHEDIKFIDYALQQVQPSEEVLRYFQVDTRPVRLKPAKQPGTRYVNENQFIDVWGLVWKKPVSGQYFDTANYPLGMAVTKEDILAYPWPSVDNLASNEGLQEEARQLFNNTQYSLVGSFGSSIYMRAQFLRGYEQLFIDMIENTELFTALLDRILDIRIQLANLLLDSAGDYLDIIELADDIAGQNGPLFSPEIYRDLIKPRTKALIDVIKSRTNARIMYHCCGSVTDFIDDFIDIGIDILNPVQVSAVNMDSRMLKNRFGRQISFHGGIDAQGVLAHGSPQDVRAETEKRIHDFWVDGGYIPFATHNIQADVSSENILAMFETINSSQMEISKRG